MLRMHLLQKEYHKSKEIKKDNLAVVAGSSKLQNVTLYQSNFQRYNVALISVQVRIVPRLP